MPPGGPPMPPGPPGMFPPPPGPKSRGPLLIAVGAVAAVVLVIATVLAVTGVFDGDDEEEITIASETTEAPESEPETEPDFETTEPEWEPTEEPSSEGGTYSSLEPEAICEVIEPIAAEYMTINHDETDAYSLTDSAYCVLMGEFIDYFEAPFIEVRQDIRPDDPGNGVEEYGNMEGVRSLCEIEEEDVLPQFEKSAYFHGGASSGCVILGQDYSLHVADGNSFWAASIRFGNDGTSLGGEKDLLIELIEAVIEAS